MAGESVSTTAVRAIEQSAGFCRDGRPLDGGGRILPRNWSFTYLVERLWPPPLIPAKEFECLTGCSDRTCRAWCQGKSEPDSWVLAAIIASDKHGERAISIILGSHHRIARKLALADAVRAAVDRIGI
ncbi:MAG TPA: hypothetical protein VKW08_08020 [Xanthobacteraceae bacterium]|jgi:hypothetical protein|nr:hypothetical protein [Xanthobacteraceae bacterium]